MFIKEIISQHRRDFSALLECEHCGHQQHLATGYDDANYHNNVIPALECPQCKRTADMSTYHPWATRYPEGMQV